MTSILIVGGNSKIGSSVAQQLTQNGCEVFKTTRQLQKVTSHTLYLDLSKPLAHWQPPPVDACLLAAAVTSLKYCQDKPQESERINVTATIQVAEKMRAQGTYVLFLSSNQVFDGTLPHVPADAPLNPLTLYGTYKAKVEAELSHWNNYPGILRLTKVLDEHSPLLQAWKTRLEKGEPVQAFDDYYMAPVAMDYVARIIADLLQNPVSGIVQVSGDKELSYLDSACMLAEAIGINGGVHAVSAITANAVSHVPAYTSLDCSRIEALTGHRGPSSVETIKQIIKRLLDPRFFPEQASATSWP